MDAFETIRTMLAVRRYQDKPVPQATLRRIVEAGNDQQRRTRPWHFIVVEDRRPPKQGARATGPSAPGGRSRPRRPGALRRLDTDQAVQSMLLAAWADGVRSNWVARGLEEVKAP
jgi:nitroreductase